MRDLRRRVIQGGMGIGASYWPLAQAVARSGGIGVVSGVCVHVLVAWMLQLGDPGGHIRRAARYSRYPRIVDEIFNEYYIAGGKPPWQPFKTVPFFTMNPSRELINLNFFANYAVVWLAKQGHDGIIGINYLEKVQLPHLSSMDGAIEGGVDCLFVGAGIGGQFPRCLDLLADLKPAEYHLDVTGALDGETFAVHYDPLSIDVNRTGKRNRPAFIPIVTNAKLGQRLITRSSGDVYGVVAENPTAAGHSAPPRGSLTLNEKGEPIYGDKDGYGDFRFFTENNIPFWLAGGYASPQGLAEAIAQGATGIQAGTIFFLCLQSNGLPWVTKYLRDSGRATGTLNVFNDPFASPSKFPFKVAQVPGTLSELEVFQQQIPACTIGALQELYRKEDGSVGYRCSAADPAVFASKGGTKPPGDSKCLCKGLFATIGLAQPNPDGSLYPPIVTAAENVEFLHHLPEPYTAEQAMQYLLSSLS